MEKTLKEIDELKDEIVSLQVKLAMHDYLIKRILAYISQEERRLSANFYSIGIYTTVKAIRKHIDNLIREFVNEQE